MTGAQLAAGMMVAAVALTVLIGRWVTAEENWVGMIVRGGMVLGIAVLALRQFGTVWYWLLAALSLVPLVETSWGEGLAAPWLRSGRERRLAEAMAAAAEQPENAVVRMRLSTALLETGQVEAGLASMKEAVSLAPEDSRDMLEQMASDAERELVRYCPSCKRPNRAAAHACRECLTALSDSAAVRGLLGIVRLVRLRSRARRRPRA